MSLAKQIIAAADTSDGASRDEILALTAKKYTVLDAKLQRLLGAGRIFRARVHGKPSRYFLSQALADAWAETQTPIPTAKEQILAVFAANPDAGYSARVMHPMLRFCSKKTVTAAMFEMAEAGELFRSHDSVTKNRFFLTQDAARQYVQIPELKRRPNAFKVATPSTAARARSSRAKDKPKDTREVIVPAGLVIQVGPCAEVFSPYQLTSKDKVPALFSKLPLGATLYGMTA